MAGRVPAAVLAVSICLAVGALVEGSALSYASGALPENSVEFQDGAGNTAQSFIPGEVATIYVRDGSLATIATSTAAWTAISAKVSAGTWWSLATGAPHPTVYTLSEGSDYKTSTPANTPLISVPSAKVNGVTTLLGEFDPATGAFYMVNNVNAGSSLQVDFDFHVVDVYGADQNRAVVASTSDADGEGVAFSEVASETDARASPVSGLFRGEVLLRGDSAALASGDGAVWVMPGDQVTVTYYEPDGATVIDTQGVTVAGPPPTPTAIPPTPTPLPVPAAGWLGLGLLAGVLALATAWRRRL